LVTLDAEDALHLDRVLRMTAGGEIGVLDGSGRLAICRLASVSKSAAKAVVERIENPGTEPHVPVVVAQALPKSSDKLEWVLQHGVEIGAAGFVIFRSCRSEAGKMAERPERWAKIVKTAAEQSGRALLPRVEIASSLDAVLEGAESFDGVLFCDEVESERTVRGAVTGGCIGSVMLIVGPEGGWTEEERQSALGRGVSPVTLGRRTLRTETAALVALSQVLFALDAG